MLRRLAGDVYSRCRSATALVLRDRVGVTGPCTDLLLLRIMLIAVGCAPFGVNADVASVD